MKDDELAHFSNPVQDILGRPPAWLLRWGIALVAGVVLALLLGAWLFRFPVVVGGRVQLFSQHPPVAVVAKTDGSIDSFFVAQGQHVRPGDAIAVVRSWGNWRHIWALSEFMGQQPNVFSDSVLGALPPLNSQLGPLHDTYTRFVYTLFSYHRREARNYFDQQTQFSQVRQQQASAEMAQATQATHIAQQELELEYRQYRRDSALHAQGVRSAYELEQAQARLLARQAQLKQHQAELHRLQAQLAQVHQGKSDWQYARLEFTERKETELIAALYALQQALAQWREQYVLWATAAGQVHYNRFWYTNQLVKQGETVLHILPSDTSSVRGRVLIAATNSGLVRPGQQALVLLDSYPHLQFGTLKAQVTWVSELPEEGYYAVELQLAEGLRTNYGYQLPMRQAQPGVAEIITERRPLLLHLLAPLRALFDAGL